MAPRQRAKTLRELPSLRETGAQIANQTREGFTRYTSDALEESISSAASRVTNPGNPTRRAVAAVMVVGGLLCAGAAVQYGMASVAVSGLSQDRTRVQDEITWVTSELKSMPSEDQVRSGVDEARTKADAIARAQTLSIQSNMDGTMVVPGLDEALKATDGMFTDQLLDAQIPVMSAWAGPETRDADTLIWRTGSVMLDSSDRSYQNISVFWELVQKGVKDSQVYGWAKGTYHVNSGKFTALTRALTMKGSAEMTVEELEAAASAGPDAPAPSAPPLENPKATQAPVPSAPASGEASPSPSSGDASGSEAPSSQSAPASPSGSASSSAAPKPPSLEELDRIREKFQSEHPVSPEEQARIRKLEEESRGAVFNP